MGKALEKAARAAITKEQVTEDLESIVYHCYSRNLALQMMRHREVIGFCSMDFGPREHAQQIALVSAETAKWEVFLRAHLDIMNDNFSRMSDGSYAQDSRGTYIAELEALEINVIDLIFGISMQVSNGAEHHYWGSLDRIGRALAESKDRKEFEDRSLQMLKDEELDKLNRFLMFALYHNYLYHLKDIMEANQKINLLKEQKEYHPFFVQDIIANMKERKRREGK